jgi:hypothetical protein
MQRPSARLAVMAVPRGPAVERHQIGASRPGIGPQARNAAENTSGASRFMRARSQSAYATPKSNSPGPAHKGEVGPQSTMPS